MFSWSWSAWVDIKTAQELLRHANSRITLDIYQQAISEKKRIAAGLAFQGLFETTDSQHPNRTLICGKKKKSARSQLTVSAAGLEVMCS
jgi:hypothetical protein